MSLEAHPMSADTYEALIRLIRNKSEDLSPAHRRVADTLLADPQRSAFLSVKQVALLAQANDATVVRFAQKLGYSGFHELRGIFQQHLNQQVHSFSDVSPIESLRSESADPIAAVANISRDSISATAARIDRKEWEAATRAAATAPRIFTLGLRHSYAAAYLLTYLLAMARNDVFALATENGIAVEILRAVGEGDVVVVISTQPYARETITAARWAHDRGATLVTLTDSEASPLAALADYCFVARTDRTTILPSSLGLTFLTESFAGHVALVDPEGARRLAEVENQLLASLQTHWKQ